MRVKNIHLITMLIMGLQISSSAFSKELLLGRAPQSSPEIELHDWTPVIEYLREQTGQLVNLKVYSERKVFEEDLVQGKLDLFFGNPAYAVVGHYLHGYIPLVRSDKKKLKGILVVRKDSPLNSAEQLQGKLIGFPGESAFAASLYVREQLRNHVGIQFNAKYFNSHNNVYRNVLVGNVVAGAGVKRTLDSEPEALRNQLRIIYETPGTSPHPLAAHPRVSAMLRNNISKALLALDETDEGQLMLKNVKLEKPMAADYDRDYKGIETISLRMYQYLIQHQD